MKPRLYNQNNEYLCTLSHATKVGYKHKLNELHTAHFSLPIGDPKNAQCLTHNIVEIFAGDVSKGKYRILEEPECEITNKGEVITYNCEFAVAFLLDDVIDGYSEIGGTSINTRYDLDWILAKQTTQRWVLDQCAFTRYFQYKFEQTSLLDATFSIPTCFDQDYRWAYDTSVYPWRINLIQQETIPSCEIRRKVNMVYIKRSVDGSLLCTRLYPKGYGEGVNQLTIADVNGGVAYLDADTQSKWGIKSSFFVDRRFENASSLKARAQQILEGIKNPYITYKAKAIDLSRVTGLAWHTFDEGKCVRMYDDVSGLVVNSIITEFGQEDVDGDPLDCDITISNETRDIASTIEELAKRTAISETYSQGATNIFCIPFSGSADPTHPKKVKIYIDESCRKINKLLVYWELENFRANSKGAASGGGSIISSAAGGAQTQTSGAGGNGTQTSAAGGAQTITQPVSVSTSNNTTGNPKDMESGYTKANTDVETARDTGASSLNTTGSAGAYENTGAATGNTGSGGAVTTGGSSAGNTGSGGGADTGNASGYTANATASHAHSVNSHRHYVNAVDTYSSYASTSTGESDNTSHNHGLGAHAHTNSTHTHSMNHTHTGGSHTHDLGSHTHTIGAHAHSMSHTHGIPTHTHGMNHYHMVNTLITIPSLTIIIESHTHSVSIPSHTHSVTINEHTHSVTLTPHEHDLVYGIFEGGIASAVTMKVDGTDVPTSYTTGTDEVDIVEWLSKDGGGKIERGIWHTLEIYPDALTDIEGCAYVQTFIQSVGGGDY